MRYVVKQFNGSYALMASATCSSWKAIVATVDGMMARAEDGDSIEISLEEHRSFTGGSLRLWGTTSDEMPGEIMFLFTDKEWFFLHELERGNKVILVCNDGGSWALYRMDKERCA